MNASEKIKGCISVQVILNYKSYYDVVLEPGGIDRSESSRNNQSELSRNSQTSWLHTPALA